MVLEQNWIYFRLLEFKHILDKIDIEKIDEFVKNLVDLRARKGRLFILGYGGSAANADHMVNDLMKICGVHAVAPTNNTALLTAVANDIDIQNYFRSYLNWVNCNENDDIFILSVSGHKFGNSQSFGLVDALEVKHNKVYGILGKSYSSLSVAYPDNFLVIPEVNPDMATPFSEAMQGVIWHILVNDPRLIQ